MVPAETMIGRRGDTIFIFFANEGIAQNYLSRKQESSFRSQVAELNTLLE